MTEAEKSVSANETHAPCALDQWLADVLRERDAAAVRHAYRLDAPPTASQAIPAALRDVAKPLGVTRERARQLLARGMDRLRRAAAAPATAQQEVVAAATAILRAAGGTLLRDDASALPSPAAFGVATAFPVLRLFADVIPATFTLHREFVTLAPPPLVDAAETFLTNRLHAADGLVPLAELVASTPQALAEQSTASERSALFAALSRSLPGFMLTRSGQAAVISAGAPSLLAGLLAEHPDSTLPFLVQAYNLLVFPSCQLGLGHIRLHLLKSPGVIRSSPNHYRLAGAHQPPLPPMPF